MLQYLQVDSELINEIISAKEYKQYKQDKYSGVKFQNFSVAEYKKILPELKKIFKDLGGGKLKRTVIFDYNSIKNESNAVLGAYDKQLIEALQIAGYEVSPESYRLGMAMKNNKAVVIHDVVVSLKAKDIDKLIAQNEKTPNENIKKQIDAIEKINNYVSYVSTIPYKISQNASRKIVISMESRKIASQSTKTGWKSCMNLDKGMYRDRVMSGIEQGVIIAWLVKTGDEKSLDSPTARLLIKPLRNIEDPNEILWRVDKVYGEAPSDFALKVDSIFKKYSSKTEGMFVLDSNKVYSGDYVGSYDLNLTDAQKQEVEDLYHKRSRDDFADKLNKLSKAQKLEYFIRYHYAVVEKLDFSKQENIDVYYTICMHEKYIIVRIQDESKIEKISKGLSEQKKLNLLNAFIQTGRSEEAIYFIDTFGVGFDTIKTLLKNKKLSSQNIKALTDRLPRAYKKFINKSSKDVISYDTTPAEFLEICYKDNQSTDDNFKQMLKENPDKYRFPKILVNDLIKEALKQQNGNYFQVIVNRLQDDYLKLADKDNLYKLLASDMNTNSRNIHAGGDVIIKLGMNNIIKLIKDDKLTVGKVLDAFKTYEDGFDNFFVKYLDAVDANDSKNMLYSFLNDFRNSNFEQMSEEVYIAMAKALLRQEHVVSKDNISSFVSHLLNSKLTTDAKKKIVTKPLEKLIQRNLNWARSFPGILTKRKTRQITEHYLRIVRGE
jgi:hypothetical protein